MNVIASDLYQSLAGAAVSGIDHVTDFSSGSTAVNTATTPVTVLRRTSSLDWPGYRPALRPRLVTSMVTSTEELRPSRSLAVTVTM